MAFEPGLEGEKEFLTDRCIVRGSGGTPGTEKNGMWWYIEALCVMHGLS